MDDIKTQQKEGSHGSDYLNIQRRKALRRWIERLPKNEFGELKYGRPMGSGELAASLQRDYQGLVESLASQVSRSLVGHQIITAVTARSVPNAWAFRNAFNDSETSVVLVTNELVHRVQSISTGASKAARECFATENGAIEFSKVWRKLPKNALHANAFGRLIGHATIALLLNHEFAHIIFGHQLNGLGCIDEASNLVGPSLDEYVYLPSSAGGVSINQSQPSGFDWSQSSELDADVHAVLWTKFYLRRFDPSSPSIADAPAEDRTVTEEILGDEYSSRFLLIVSFWALFFALGGHPFNLSKISEGTHPQVGMRLALMTYAEQQLEVQFNGEKALVPDADRFGALVGKHTFVGMQSTEEIYDLIGYKAIFQSWNEVTRRTNFLGSIRRQRQSSLLRRKIETALPTVKWWAD